MKTIITEQLISHDIDGLPKGMLVELSTFTDTNQFVSKVTRELIVLPKSAIDSLDASVQAVGQEKAALQNQLTTKTTEADSLTAQVATLNSQLTSLPSLQSQLAEALALVEEYRPFDPNQIKSASFYERITKDELFTLAVLAGTDANAAGILSLLSAYKANEWQVLLDDPQVVGAMQYLQSVGMLNADRVSQLLQPATKDEAYVV